MSETSKINYDFPLNGKLRTSSRLHRTQLSEGDFIVLNNMRYTRLSIKSILGMSKVNTTVLSE